MTKSRDMTKRKSAETQAKMAAALPQIPVKEIRAAVRELHHLAEEGQRTLRELKCFMRTKKE